jgi:hypothetical protein
MVRGVWVVVVWNYSRVCDELIECDLFHKSILVLVQETRRLQLRVLSVLNMKEWMGGELKWFEAVVRR